MNASPSKPSFLIAGGCGFIGCNLVRRILDGGFHCIVLDNLLTGKKEHLPAHPSLELHIGDVNDRDLIAGLIGRADYVIDAATVNIILAEKDPFLVNKTNIEGTLALLEAAVRSPRLKKFLYCSSASIYGNPEYLPIPEHMKPNPLSSYAVTKLAGEHYVMIYYILKRLPVNILRYSNVFGPYQTPDSPYSGVIGRFFGAVEAGETIKVVGSGTQTRDFTYIDDVTEATLAVTLDETVPGQIFNVASGHETSIVTLARAIFALYGKEPKIDFVHKRENIDNISRRCLNIEQIRIRLQWEPSYDLESGLAKTREWFESRKKI